MLFGKLTAQSEIEETESLFSAKSLLMAFGTLIAWLTYSSHMKAAGILIVGSMRVLHQRYTRHLLLSRYTGPKLQPVALNFAPAFAHLTARCLFGIIAYRVSWRLAVLPTPRSTSSSASLFTRLAPFRTYENLARLVSRER